MYQQQPPHMEQPPSGRDTLEAFVNLLTIVVRAWACSMYVFTRRKFGQKYFTASFFAAIPIIGFFGLATSQTAAQMSIHVGFIWLWVTLMIIHQVSKMYRKDEDEVPSNYDGWPRICDWMNVSEANAKTYWEPVLCVLVGAVVMMIDISLGSFIGIGGLAIGLDHQRNVDGIREKVRQIRDAELEQELIRKEYERLYGRK